MLYYIMVVMLSEGVCVSECVCVSEKKKDQEKETKDMREIKGATKGLDSCRTLPPLLSTGIICGAKGHAWGLA